MKFSRSRHVIRIFILGFTIPMVVLGALCMWEIIPSSGLTWREIVVGVSTKEDVINKLGVPDQTYGSLLTSTLVYDEPARNQVRHLIIIRFGVVQQITEDTYKFDNFLYLNELVTKYGPPSIVEWSRESPSMRTIVYPSEGVIANVTPFEKQDEAKVYNILYTKPMPGFLMRIKFMKVFSSLGDPFSGIDIVGPKDPWFGTSDAYRD